MSLAYGDLQNSSPAVGIWHSLNRFLLVLILLMVAAVIGYRFLPEVTKRREQQARLDQLKLEVEREKQFLARTLRENELLKHDTEYIGLIARDRLDLMKEGETIYRLEPLPVDKARMHLNR